MMRAALMYAAGDVRVEDIPAPAITDPTDALVRVTHGSICGSDLWPYRSLPQQERGLRMGHEFMGVVEAVGTEVRTIKPGDLVVAPFAVSDGTCEFCRMGLHTACVNVRGWGGPDGYGGQGEAVLVPWADGTLAVMPDGAKDEALAPSLVTLSDVMATGHHAAVRAQAGPGRVVAVVGDGAVGLCGVIAARRLGAEQIILMGRHPDRVALAREFGATDIVSERGDEGVQSVKDLTAGLGAHSVLEAVGLGEAIATAIKVCRPGGAIGRVGVPQDKEMPEQGLGFFKNITIGGGPAPARAYVDELLPDVLQGRINPGRVFDRRVDVDGVPDGYRAMNDREAIKVLVDF